MSQNHNGATALDNEDEFCNVAAYKFVTLDAAELIALRKKFKQRGTALSIKGTILLSTEGINLFLAGHAADIENFQKLLHSHAFFEDLSYKYSYSRFIPFEKLFVKIRTEIVTFRQPHIQPAIATAPYLSPQDLYNKLQRNDDFLLLDTRNTFEYEMGSFDKATHLNIENFREFPDALHQNDDQLDKNKPVVTFCTGGIRCEKAAAYLLEQGFREVYQLQGGILNYFAECGGEHYTGNCFVFDDRVAINDRLEPVDN
ncbi:MAG: sulfurtransferase [Gammaproteobacteria bacterium]|nr:sulfurtransferase [Gammaproteobacteria bacterium]